MPGADVLDVLSRYAPVAPTVVNGYPRVEEVAPGVHGILCESQRSNLCWNPSARVNGTGWWGAGGVGATYARDATVGLTTGTSMRVTCDGTAAGQGVGYTQATPFPAGGVIVASAWVYSAQGGEKVTMRYWFDVPGYTALAGLPTANYTLQPGWQRLSLPAYTMPTTTTSTDVGMYISSQAASLMTYWVTDLQLETGSDTTVTYPTSFLSGDLSTVSSAYSWDATGTALLTNGSFETGNTTGWTAENGVAIAAVSATPAAALGTWSCQVSGSGDFYQFYNSAAVSQIFCLSWYQNNNGATLATAPSVTVSAESSTGTVLAQYTLTLPTTTTGWQRGALKTGVLPTNTAKLLVQFFGGGPADVYYLDGIQLDHRPYPTGFAAAATALATSSTRAASRARWTLPAPQPGSNVAQTGYAYTVLGWARMGYTPSATTGLHMLCSGAPTPYIAFSSNVFYAYASGLSTSITPTSPVLVGDLVFFAAVIDPANSKTLVSYIGHNGVLQQSNAAALSVVSTMTDLTVGTYYSESDSSSYSANSPVGPITVLSRALSTNDIARYWNAGPAIDPTADGRVVAVVGYGDESLGMTAWEVNHAPNALGGVQALAASYVGSAFHDDGAGNVLPTGQVRFSLPLSTNPNYAPIAAGQVASIGSTDGTVSLYDHYTVTSVRESTPGQIDIICTRSAT